MMGAEEKDPEISVMNEEESGEPEATDDEMDLDRREDTCAKTDDEDENPKTTNEDIIKGDEEVKPDTSMEDETEGKDEEGPEKKVQEDETEIEEINGSEGLDQKTSIGNEEESLETEVAYNETNSDKKEETPAKTDDEEETIHKTNKVEMKENEEDQPDISNEDETEGKIENDSEEKANEEEEEEEKEEINGLEVKDPETSIRNDEESGEPDVTHDGTDSDRKEETCAKTDDEEENTHTTNEDEMKGENEVQHEISKE